MFGWLKGMAASPKRQELDEMADIREKLNAIKRQGGPEIDAHAHCNSNRTELADSERAGCFYCCEVYQADEVDDWVDSDQCALCPKCGIDSVIGDASGFPVTDPLFLKKMHEIWF